LRTRTGTVTAPELAGETPALQLYPPLVVTRAL